MSVFDDLTKDLDWREGELASFRILINEQDLPSSQRRALLRAAWTILYAHYEGYTKHCLEIFFGEISYLAQSCKMLPERTRAFALQSHIAKMRNLPVVDFIEAVENFDVNIFARPPHFPEIDTKSNLWPNVLSDILKRADIDVNFLDRYRTVIGRLVSQRNNIAHGKNDTVHGVAYFLRIESEVVTFLYELSYEIEKRLQNVPYK